MKHWHSPVPAGSHWPRPEHELVTQMGAFWQVWPLWKGQGTRDKGGESEASVANYNSSQLQRNSRVAVNTVAGVGGAAAAVCTTAWVHADGCVLAARAVVAVHALAVALSVAVSVAVALVAQLTEGRLVAGAAVPATTADAGPVHGVGVAGAMATAAW